MSILSNKKLRVAVIASAAGAMAIAAAPAAFSDPATVPNAPAAASQPIQAALATGTPSSEVPPADDQEQGSGYPDTRIRLGGTVKASPSEAVEGATYALAEGDVEPLDISIDANTGEVTVIAPATVEGTINANIGVERTDPDSDEPVTLTLNVKSIGDDISNVEEYTPGYETTVVKPGEEKNIQQTGDDYLPTDTTYAVDAESVPEGWTVTINEENGELTVKVPEGYEGDGSETFNVVLSSGENTRTVEVTINTEDPAPTTEPTAPTTSDTTSTSTSTTTSTSRTTRPVTTSSTATSTSTTSVPTSVPVSQTPVRNPGFSDRGGIVDPDYARQVDGGYSVTGEEMGPKVDTGGTVKQSPLDKVVDLFR